MSSLTTQDSRSNLRGVIIFTLYLSTCTSLTFLILRDLFKQSFRQNAARRDKPRQRQSGHEGYQPAYRVQLFSALAAASLAVTWFYMFSFFSLSYRAWAVQEGVPLPKNLSAAFSTDSEVTLRIGPWLKDVTLFRDAWEVVLETSPRLFWSQPIFFVTTAWSIFLGIETHRRQIPHSWAYMLLGQIVAISFAQNLFFLAVLLFPLATVSTNRGVSSAISSKTLSWTPTRALYSICVLLTFISVSLIPWVTGTSWFMKVLIIPHFILVLPSVMHTLCPAGWGIQHRSLASANKYLASLYQLIAVLLVYSQLRVGLELIIFHRRGSGREQLHRHSAAMPETHHLVDRAQGPWSVLAAALYEHPAVSSVGWDVLLCSLSFFCWRLTGTGNTNVAALK